MTLNLARRLLLSTALLLIAPAALPFDLGAPEPLTEPLEGVAWSRSESVSSVWNGDHFLAVWVERRDDDTDGESFLMAGRFGPQGERIDGHGIELEQRSQIQWARVVVANGKPHAVYQVADQLLVARVEEDFELTPVLSHDVSIYSGDAAANGDRILVTWRHWGAESGPVQAIIADVAAATVNGPIAIDDGYDPSVAVDGDGFLVTYNERWSPPGGIKAARIGSDGTVRGIVLIDEIAGRQGPSVAWTGSGHLIAYGEHDYPHHVQTRYLSAEGELGEIRSWDSADFGRVYIETASMTAGCSSDQCLVVAEIFPICEFSPCPVPSDLFVMRFDLEGTPLDEEWTLLRDVSFTSTHPRITSSGNTLLVTWEADSRGYGSVIEGSEASDAFYLSSGATNQRNPVGADGSNGSLVLWSESEDFNEQRCLRAALLSRSGQRIAETDVTECIEGLGSWSASGDGSSWLAVWREYDEELETSVTRGRIMQPHDLSGETFLVAEEYSNRIATAGGSSGHLLVWPRLDGLVATRVSSTGLVTGEPWRVLWGKAYQPLLVNLGSGFALIWDDPWCSVESCGLQYRFLTAEGQTYGDPVAIGSRGRVFDAVEAPGGEALLVWTDELYDIRAAFIREDRSVSDLGFIGSLYRAGAVHVGRDGNGFIVAVARHNQQGRPIEQTLLIRLDASGKVEGVPHLFEGTIQEVVGDGLLIEQQSVDAPPFYGAPRLFLRPTGDAQAAPTRRRPVRGH